MLADANVALLAELPVYISDLGPHIKVAWGRFEKNPICAFQTVFNRSDYG